MDLELLHPPIVHFAIALTITGTLFEVLYFITKKESLKHAGFWTFFFGAIFVVLAALTGHLAEEAVEGIARGEAHEILERHEELGNILAGMLLVLALLRLFIHMADNKRLHPIFLVGAIISSLLIAYQGNLGGKLVYEYGVIPSSKPAPADEGYKHDLGEEEHEEHEEHEEEEE
jgi:uncharacterized membrane protein